MTVGRDVKLYLIDVLDDDRSQTVCTIDVPLAPERRSVTILLLCGIWHLVAAVSVDFLPKKIRHY